MMSRKLVFASGKERAKHLVEQVEAMACEFTLEAHDAVTDRDFYKAEWVKTRNALRGKVRALAAAETRWELVRKLPAVRKAIAVARGRKAAATKRGRRA
jgi:hypothetical protein